ncbi:dihydroceramide fatty acyl 2-hydroxylase FAH2 [Drosophila grimshawi]|uniref:dihydroceramide fatty acyl 2-hydroxylase FAH2 n=1 Tax=Drosophila grimshawi TaxID=7222 RepID=UPI000C871497|nr:dihydroceramide fatty acyl 2-hydroxylase FAH2 [Drosophila grimshawi]XP_032589793.1 dihydroceramide fatty acyl 2-hydroxylase FAH2 [Drosophila grimshawi]
MDTLNGTTEQRHKFTVKYRQEYYDLSNFMHKHPGGINTLKGLNQTDMTARFLKAPPHSDAAMYLMREYKISAQDYEGKKKTKERPSAAKLADNGIELLEQTKQSAEDSNNNQLDDSMEFLVDWSEAMLPQIGKITKHYDEWVHKPVDRPLRLFGPWYLEILTKTPWWIVPAFWIPSIIACGWQEFQENSHNMKGFTVLFSHILFGVLFWTLLEYSLHRWVFHVKLTSDSGPWLCTLHFMIHGLHHKVPFDPMRLVFPPLPGVILATVIYTPLYFILQNHHPRLILVGALVGYLGYDMIHYYLHYGSPSAGQHLYEMKRYHYQHHFAHQDLGYGISSPLWDIVFNTRIYLRKLKFQLKWA